MRLISLLLLFLSGGPAIADTLLFATAPTAIDAERWRVFSDRVMGGVSRGSANLEEVAGRRCLRMQGQVRLENNGGFIQVASDLYDSERAAFGRASGIALDVYGNDETYNLHLRTSDMRRPWQSYRASFTAPPRWQTLRLPFADFEPHRIDGALDPAAVRRVGLVAIGRAFAADLCVSRVSLYSEQAP